MKKFLICFLIGILVLLPANEVLAVEQMDLDKKGSIEIILRDTKGNVVQDGIIAVQKVADVHYDNQDYSYVYTEQFVNSGYSLDKTGMPELAVKLHEYALDNGITGNSYNNTEGKIEVGNLTAGLYLVSQKTAASGYSAMVPFLVSMPYQSNGKWTYEVDAAPKISPVNQETIAPEPSTETATETSTEAESEKGTSGDVPEGADTGDKTPIMMYIGLMCIAVCAGGISIACKLADDNEEKAE